jgi:hypothetical protein
MRAGEQGHERTFSPAILDADEPRAFEVSQRPLFDPSGHAQAGKGLVWQRDGPLAVSPDPIVDIIPDNRLRALEGEKV